MSELDLKYCPYCEKNVPYRKASRGGALAFGIIATIMVPSYLLLFYFMIWRLLGFIIFIVAITIFVIFEIFYWRWYSKRLRFFCNICKSTVQPKSQISDTSVKPTEVKVGYCPNCGAAKGNESAGFCSFCGTKIQNSTI
jgi:hypothetical protein